MLCDRLKKWLMTIAQTLRELHFALLQKVACVSSYESFLKKNCDWVEFRKHSLALIYCSYGLCNSIL